METPDSKKHLSQITTLWSVVCDAHHGTEFSQRSARQVILDRYRGAIVRYLRKALGSNDEADDLYQEWAVRFLKGRLKNANPKKGRFRDFLKTVLYHLIIDFRTEKYKRLKIQSPADIEPIAKSPSLPESDRAFIESWRAHLLARSWKALQEIETSTGQPVHTTLRLRVDESQLRSSELAEQLSQKLGKTINANAARQMLYRARDRFAELLFDEVLQSLQQPTVDEIEQELIELDLLRYCKGRLKQLKVDEESNH